MHTLTLVLINMSEHFCSFATLGGIASHEVTTEALFYWLSAMMVKLGEPPAISSAEGLDARMSYKFL